MIIFIYVCILILFFTLIFFLKDISLTVTFVCSLFVISFIANPSICIETCISGASLFFYKVFPSLFPFLIICNIILLSNGVYIYSKLFGKILCIPLGLPLQCSFVVMVSILCGYPLGTKYSCELYEKGIIDYDTCETLLNIASNPSPLFIIGTIGTAMLNDTKLGYILLLTTYLSCFVMSIILRKPHCNVNKNTSYSVCNKSNINIGDILKVSIDNGVKTSLSVGGFIIIFSVINGIIKNSTIFNAILNKLYYMFNIPKGISEGLLLGLIEMTNGCNMICSSNIVLDIKIILIGFFIGFSGICIMFQCNSFMSKHKFSLGKYAQRKILQGIICSAISYTLYKLLYTHKEITIFNETSYNLINTDITLFIMIICAMLIPFLGYKLREF